jgi:hypothetical protein
MGIQMGFVVASITSILDFQSYQSFGLGMIYWNKKSNGPASV